MQQLGDEVRVVLDRDLEKLDVAGHESLQHGRLSLNNELAPTLKLVKAIEATLDQEIVVAPVTPFAVKASARTSAVALERENDEARGDTDSALARVSFRRESSPAGTLISNARDCSPYCVLRFLWLRRWMSSSGFLRGKQMSADKRDKDRADDQDAAADGREVEEPKDVSPAASREPLISRFGGVPIIVVRPPSRLPYASGISRREAGIRVRRATSMTTGSISAATPMLFMNADKSRPSA